MEKPKFGVTVYFKKDNSILVNGVLVQKEKLQDYLDNIPCDKPNKYIYSFDKDLNYGNYINSKILMRTLKFPFPALNLTDDEFVF
jgi:biopolymer transport protein ExbD